MAYPYPHNPRCPCGSPSCLAIYHQLLTIANAHLTIYNSQVSTMQVMAYPCPHNPRYPCTSPSCFSIYRQLLTIANTHLTIHNLGYNGLS